ncbi:xanthine dehydrogenase family protein subunit M [Blastococcus sp. CT_GayMR20]|uniref:FAD binding domain-containing protein n=1 Tax=Blastococcus sp. CT_GayMR20 TaxID=2559609 RepID=UPI001072FA8F|nr:xanthine dehydrogenase family protein subunit M [Blastococcus sp. CT_GayMR20]TFV67948.1 xanthine dehydrogenase family protein subunit M [Blastococcus sp. CT_GayMR20]
MKPAPFEYVAPTTLAEALDVLDTHGDEVKILAGGQSLGPLLNLRLATPSVLVDINRVPGLDRIEVDDGHLRVGALVRQRAAERSAVLGGAAPLAVEALHSVGHIGIRNRGTLAGSIAHADPSAEMPAVLTVLGGSVRAVSRAGDRTIPAAALFQTYFTTVLEPEEMVVEVLLPRRPVRTGHAWLEFAQRHGDFAIVGVGAVVTLDEDGRCRAARVVCTGVDSVPFDASEVAATLVGSPVDGDACAAVADAVARTCQPGTDVFADASYRRRLIRSLVPRALQAAGRRAQGEADGE